MTADLLPMFHLYDRISKCDSEMLNAEWATQLTFIVSHGIVVEKLKWPAAVPLRGEDFLALQNVRGLVHLNLSETTVEDVDLFHLRLLPGLRALSLRCTRITDAGIQHVAKALPLLESLDLQSTDVTNACSADLMLLTRLKTLHVACTDIR
jgi:hypothetical protein